MKHIATDHGATVRERGFTLIELLVVIILTGMLSTMILSFFLDFWGEAATLQNDSETFVSRQDAGDALRRNLNVATHLINQNSISDVNTNDPDPGDATGTHWLIIHAIPGTYTMPASGSVTPVFYFEAPSVDSSRNFIMNGTQPYYDEFILYMNGSTKQLLMRTLVNPSATNDRLKTSCPASVATTSCPADADIADSISSVGLRYFSRSGNTIDYTSVTDPTSGQYIGPDFEAVEVAELTLNFSRNSTLSNGASTTNETIIRVALRNS